MGHLTRIANSINEHREKGNNSDRIKEIFQGTVQSFICQNKATWIAGSGFNHRETV